MVYFVFPLTTYIAFSHGRKKGVQSMSSKLTEGITKMTV